MVPCDVDPVLPAPKAPRSHRQPPYRGRVLVLAPHPDDEAIGPGATLVAHARLGDPIFALFVSSGVHGDPDGVHDAAAYVDLRMQEAKAAAEVLGIGETEFWGYPDSMVVTEGDMAGVADRLAELLGRLKPDVIYAPHRGESHSDHHFVCLAAERAHRAAGCRAPVLGYEVWSPLAADIAVDAADTQATKLEAIRCYGSQLRHHDIVAAVDGLNAFRAVLLPPGGRRAEAFEVRA